MLITHSSPLCVLFSPEWKYLGCHELVFPRSAFGFRCRVSCSKFRAILGEGEKFKGLVDFCTLNVLVHLRTRRMQAVTCSLQRHWVNTRELRAAKPTALVSRSFWLKAKLDRSKRNGETDCKQSYVHSYHGQIHFDNYLYLEFVLAKCPLD